MHQVPFFNNVCKKNLAGLVSVSDFIIIGAGIIGLSIARELKRRYRDSRVVILEKEGQVGEHASGRNSGVLHAGFYYTDDSFKARFTKEGNAAMSVYCLEKSIPLNRCGKLVVTRCAKERSTLYELKERGIKNKIPLELISAKEAKEIEPRVKTDEEALFSPTTSSVDPKLVLQHMERDAKEEGISIHLGVQYLSHHHRTIKTNQGDYVYRFLVNTAGLYADKIARELGFSEDFYVLPFKGLYLYSTQSEALRTHIYPVPDLRYPFLGVHFTVDAAGRVKIGPTAIPAFWREQYQGFSRFNYKEMVEILYREIGLFVHAGFDFRRLAWHELKKYNRGILTKHASELVTHLDSRNYKMWGKPGIRAQLLNIKTRRLEMDFIFEGDDHSLHILNAISPAFTCAIPFARHAVDHIEAVLK